ncbi:hypothetical protein INR49_032458 [Caranx melampygus]|nr:hypothetical protein INR49_032458 [Caranx melampygus]
MEKGLLSSTVDKIITLQQDYKLQHHPRGVFSFVVAVIGVYLSTTLESCDSTSVCRAECRTV